MTDKYINHQIDKRMEKFFGNEANTPYYFVELAGSDKTFIAVFVETKNGYKATNMKGAMRDIGFPAHRTTEQDSMQAMKEFWKWAADQSGKPHRRSS